MATTSNRKTALLLYEHCDRLGTVIEQQEALIDAHAELLDLLAGDAVDADDAPSTPVGDEIEAAGVPGVY